MNSKLLDKLSARQSATRDVIRSLQHAAKQTYSYHQKLLIALAMRIEQCNQSDNHFYTPNAINFSTGEEFEAVGRMWQCGSKLCPNCLAKQAARNRKKLRESMDAQQLRRGERYYFVTFTIVNPKKSLLETRDIVNRAWELFRKRKLVVDLVRGGVKSEEFTLTANGFHYHLHGIFLAKFILFNEARRVWTECVEKAFAEAGLELQVNNKDGMLSVHFKQLTDREGAIQEVCKYITKSDSWSKMRTDDLSDVALIKRWFRMFELFGSFAIRNTKELDMPDDSAALPPILDTSNLTDGVSPSHEEYWREWIMDKTVEDYRSRLYEEIARTQQARMMQLKLRYPDAKVVILSDGILNS